MSQEKVNKYKESKKTRKQDVAKQKKEDAFKALLWKVILGVVVIGLVVGIVISVVNTSVAKKKAMKDAYVAENFLINDLADITGAEADE